MKVFCYPAARGSLYLRLLYGAIEDRYQPQLGPDANPRLALQALQSGEDVVMHIHWEEFVFFRCRTVAEADAEAVLFRDLLSAFHRAGGRIFWTIHNLLPHHIPHIAPFLEVRRFLADIADAILVHNDCAVPILRAQLDLPVAKVIVLPHPAYTGLYEPEEIADAQVGGPAEPLLLCFGTLRLQKNFGEAIDMLPAAFLADRGVRIQVSGTGPDAETIRAAHGERTDVVWDLHYVPMAEAPPLIRSAACTILPYRRFLTSGVAMLVMSVGGLLVAADAPQFREILPARNHRFLYRPDDAADFRRVIDSVLTLSQEERAVACRANFKAARNFAPELIGRRLASYYDGVVAVR